MRKNSNNSVFYSSPDNFLAKPQSPAKNENPSYFLRN